MSKQSEQRDLIGQAQAEPQQVLSQAAQDAINEAKTRKRAAVLAKELNGPKGLEPTRYGDWEAKGRCYDF